ncbi:MAG TPA: PAS domain-containing protein, partial [Gemmatimonadales bacterium]|nr:PAS domain-containing protein [Gemmatimonadales bacterium]
MPVIVYLPVLLLLSLLPRQASGGRLEVALSFVTAVCIGILIVVGWRDRRGRRTAGDNGTQGDSDASGRPDPADLGWWTEHHRTPDEQAISYATVKTDSRGRCLTWNPSVERILGYRKDEFIDRRLADLYTPEDQADGVVERSLGEAANSGSFTGERWIVRKDGTRFPAQVSLAR